VVVSGQRIARGFGVEGGAMRRLTILVVPVVASLLTVAPGVAMSQAPRAAAASPNAVTQWNENAAKAAAAACLIPGDPLHEARLYAMVHLAIHDALNAIARRFRPYIAGLRGPKTASPEAAVAAAAHDVLVSVIGHVPTNFPNCV